MSIPKINIQVWVSYMKKMTITVQMKRKVWCRGQIFVRTSEGVSVAKFGDHALRHLASRLANVIREGGRQTKNLIF